MIPKRDNYAIQAEDARLRFLGYDQNTMPAEKDESFLYLPFCGCDYRISRSDGHIFRRAGNDWLSADSHGEVLTLFDYLCDARPDRAPAGEFVSMASLGGHVHGGLVHRSGDLERLIDQYPEAFCRVCTGLGGVPGEGGDLCFDLRLFPDLPVRLRFWHSDEEFEAYLDLFWDKNALSFLRYETTWYALGILRRQIAHGMNQSIPQK